MGKVRLSRSIIQRHGIGVPFNCRQKESIMRVSAVLLSLLFLPVLGFGATIYVPGDFPTIQQAVDAAVNNDLIVVASGNYQEQVTVDGKTLTIDGAGIGTTVIQSPASLSTTFTTTQANKCIVGVINSGNLTVQELTIDGLGYGNSNFRFIGVGFRNAGGLISSCALEDLQDTPLGGTQHGVGVYAINDDGTDRNVSVSNCNFTEYQKSGVALSGANVIGSVSGSTFTGQGQTSAVDQNGIQFDTGARGTVNSCTVTGHCYTGPSLSGVGLLLNAAGTVNVSNCASITDNQYGAYFIQTSGTFTNNTVSSGINAHGAGGSYYGVVVDDIGDRRPSVRLFGDGKGRQPSGYRTTVSFLNCVFDADTSGHGTGIAAWALNSDNVDVHLTTCEITDWELGMDVWDDGTALPTVTVLNSKFGGNTNYAILNSTTNVVSAAYNWWGDTTGPYNMIWNPGGQGDSVSDNVWFLPWLEGDDDLTVPWDYPTIQSAIDAAVSGQTVVVGPGDYEEQITVDAKNLTVLGAGKGSSNILAPATLQTTFVTSGQNKCILGVVNGAQIDLRGFTIDGQGRGNSNYRFMGIGFRNTAGQVSDCEIKDVRDTPLSSANHGVGIYALIDDGVTRTVSITDTDLVGYQKSGIVIGGANAVANISGCALTGAGRILVTPQNGIQLAYGVNGFVDGCTVSDHCYTGGTYTASGILIYDCGLVDVEDCPLIQDNQTGVYYIQTSGSFTNNTVTAGVDAWGNDEKYFGLALGNDFSGTHAPAVSLFNSDGDSGGPGQRTQVSVTNSTLTADKSGQGMGIGAWAASYDDVNLDVRDSVISDWSMGIEVWEDTSATATVYIHECDITGNDTFGGVVNHTTNVVPAEWNWWGHPTGPHHPLLNPHGKGNKVSDNVDFMPFKYLQPETPEFFGGITVPGDYATIQEAIDGASSGDVINVGPGNFNEQLLVDGKSLTIVGSGKDKTRIVSPFILNTSFTANSIDYKCVVGVINGGNLALRRVMVDGLGLGNLNVAFTGVGIRNSGGTVSNCLIKDFKDTPMSGSQYGVGVYAYNDDGTTRKITVKNTEFTGYQKTGISLAGPNVDSEIALCTLEGSGATNLLAQNGIQYVYKAAGAVKSCTARNHVYTGASTFTGCGIVFYGAGTVQVKDCKEIVDNQVGIYFVNTTGAMSGNTITAGVNAHGTGGEFYGMILDDEGARTPHVSLFGVTGPGERQAGSRANSVTLSNCVLTSDQSGAGIGISIWAQFNDNIEVDIAGCQVRNWVWGIEAWDDGTAVPTVDVLNSAIAGNLTFGIYNQTSSLLTAEYNWWGDATGPYHNTLNPTGQGDTLEGYVWFANWLTKDPFGRESVSLDVDDFAISAAQGGSLGFGLDAGAANAFRSYVLLGSLSGTTPGTVLPGGEVTLPVNRDWFFSTLLGAVNSGFLPGFMGSLNAAGRAEAAFHVPAGLLLPLAGEKLFFAYALNGPWDYVSEPVMVFIFP